MANGLYALGFQAIFSGSIDFLTATIKAALVTNSYTPNLLTDQYYSTISADVIGSPVALSSVAFSGFNLTAANTTQSSVSSGHTITYIVIYMDTGSSSTSPLLAIFDTMYGLPYSTNGGNFTIFWPGGVVLQG